VLLRDLPTHLDFAAAGKTEEGVPTRTGCLAYFGPACEDDSVGRCDDACSREAGLRLCEHRSGHLHARIVCHGCGATLFDVFSRKGSGLLYTLRSPIFRGGQCSLCARLLERGCETIHLWFEDRGVELRQH